MTRVDAGGAGHALRVDLESGSVVVEGLTLSHAAHGLYVDADGSASVSVKGCRLVENSNAGQSFTYGSGMWAELNGAASLDVDDLVSASNAIAATGSDTAVGAGVSIFGSGQSTVVLRRALIEGNTGQTEGNQVTGVGVHLRLNDTARAELEDVVVLRNEAVLPPGSGAVGVGGALWINDSSQLSVTRSLWLANMLNPDRPSEQLSLITGEESSLRFADSVVAHSGAPYVAGATVDQRGASTLRLTGCTFADNPRAGLFGRREGGVAQHRELDRLRQQPGSPASRRRRAARLPGGCRPDVCRPGTR